MKISLNWLSDFLPGPLDAEAASDALMRGGLPVESIERHGDDTVLDVEVTSNRSDCLSHIGVARELAALMDRPFQRAATIAGLATEGREHATSVTSVRIEAPDLCPHYTARVIQGVRIGPSPDWLRLRLEAIGLRPISNVVDITNYVMFEMGQPLHAFDFDKLSGRRIVVRRAAPGEKLLTLDGKQADLAPDMLTISDAEQPVALAGVMGGLDSEVTANTRSVLLESARFDPLSIRKTSRALAMRSDSSYRYERGLDPTLPVSAGLRAAQLIVALAGGEMLSGFAEAGSAGAEPRFLKLRLASVEKVLGVSLPTDRMMSALSRLGFAPVVEADAILVTVPTHRLDIAYEVDLIEEVARTIGYDEIPVREEISIRVTPPEPRLRILSDIRTTLVGSGYFEAVTLSLAAGPGNEEFIPRGTATPIHVAAHRSPQLRSSLLPGLLQAASSNESLGNTNAKFFEVGASFWYGPTGIVDERRRLGLVGSSELREVRGALEAIMLRLDSHRPMSVAPDERPGFARGACGRVEWGGETIGYLGRISPRTADLFKLREPRAMAEVELTALLAGAKIVPQLTTLAKFPAVERDLSLVLAESVRYEAVESLIRKSAPQWLEGIDYVTTYRGKPLEKGTKSMTIKLLFRSASETLTGEQVESAVSQVIAKAASELGASLRT